MNNFFIYDANTGNVELNTPDILLVKEFEALLDSKRNKCKEDPEGKYKLRAFREFKYILLAINWQSPYADFTELDRHLEALRDATITEEEWNNPEFRAACRKYRALQESNRSIKMLGAARNTVDKFVDYFNNIDPEERDELTGKPIFKVKDIMAEISNLHKVHEELQILEGAVKREISEKSSIRAGAVEGFTPTII